MIRKIKEVLNNWQVKRQEKKQKEWEETLRICKQMIEEKRKELKEKGEIS